MAEITINKLEYEMLVRDSERIRIIERLILNDCSVLDEDYKAILGLPKKKVTE